MSNAVERSIEDNAIGSPQERSPLYETPPSDDGKLSPASLQVRALDGQLDITMAENTPKPPNTDAFTENVVVHEGSKLVATSEKMKRKMSDKDESSVDHRAPGSPYFYLTDSEQHWMDKTLGYTFKNVALLYEALQISGPGNGLKVVCGRPCPDGNKRLAFVGAQAIRTVIAIEWYPGHWNTSK